MPEFNPNMKGDFIFEEIAPIPEYHCNTNEYVFFRRYGYDTKIFIYRKDNRKLVKTLDWKGHHFTTDLNTIYLRF